MNVGNLHARTFAGTGREWKKNELRSGVGATGGQAAFDLLFESLDGRGIGEFDGLSGTSLGNLLNEVNYLLLVGFGQTAELINNCSGGDFTVLTHGRTVSSIVASENESNR